MGHNCGRVSIVAENCRVRARGSRGPHQLHMQLQCRLPGTDALITETISIAAETAVRAMSLQVLHQQLQRIVLLAADRLGWLTVCAIRDYVAESFLLARISLPSRPFGYGAL